VEVQQHYYLLSYLSSFSAVEKLSGKSKCWCDNCCHLQDAKKKLKVKSAPQVLTCQLKGFKYTVHEGEMEGFKKLFYHVAFPMEYILPINNCGDGEADDFLYSSFDVVVHVGCMWDARLSLFEIASFHFSVVTSNLFSIKTFVIRSLLYSRLK